jgi:hypothetical protein
LGIFGFDSVFCGRKLIEIVFVSLEGFLLEAHPLVHLAQAQVGGGIMRVDPDRFLEATASGLNLISSQIIIADFDAFRRPLADVFPIVLYRGGRRFLFNLRVNRGCGQDEPESHGPPDLQYLVHTWDSPPVREVVSTLSPFRTLDARG